MLFPTTSLTIITLLGVSPAAPALLPRNQATCTMFGLIRMNQYVSSPTSATLCDALSGGMGIHCTTGQHWSSDDLPEPRTIKAKDTGLPQDLQWDVDWTDGGQIAGCSLGYRGGKPIHSNADPPSGMEGVGATGSSSSCSATVGI